MTPSTAASASKKLTKKQLKATAFRSKKKIKELLNDKILPLPEEEEEEDDDDDKDQLNESTQKDPSSPHPSASIKKRKRSDTLTDPTAPQDHQEAQADHVISTTASKRRNRKKAAKLKENQANDEIRNSKLILFVGNLPFEITSDKLKKFFWDHCAEEPSVRLITTKPTRPDEKPTTKGCGFVEFQSSTALQKALRLHHTLISSDADPDKENQKKKSRKINIELTAGGGGKSENRLKKIQAAQDRLSKQREKIFERNLKSTTIEKNSNDGRLVQKDHSQFDVSIKLGTRKNDPKIYKPKLKPSLSGANSIKLG